MTRHLHTPSPTPSAPARRLAATLSLAALAVVGVACTSSQEGGADAGPDTTAAATSTAAPTTTVAPTTVPPTTAPTTVAPTAPPTTAAPTTAPAPTCPDRTPSGGAVEVNVVNGDWNGDGAADSALSWAEVGGGGPNWYVRIQVSGGGNSVVDLGDVGPGFAAVLGAVDVDYSIGAPPGEVRDELLAIVGSNAAGYNLGVFAIDDDGCAFRFDNGGGDPYEIPVHNAAAAMSGMRCDGGMGTHFITRLEATTADGTNWDTTDVWIERSDTDTLVDGMEITGSLATGDPELDAYGQAQCGGTMFIGPGGDF